MNDIIIISGYPCSGKTYLAEYLSKKLNIYKYHIDNEVNKTKYKKSLDFSEKLDFFNNIYGQYFLTFLNHIYYSSKNQNFILDAPLIEKNRRWALEVLLKNLKFTNLHFIEMTCRNLSIWKNRNQAKGRILGIDESVYITYRNNFESVSNREEIFKSCNFEIIKIDTSLNYWEVLDFENKLKNKNKTIMELL